MSGIKELRQRVDVEIPAEAKALREEAEAEDREFTPEEKAKIEELKAEKKAGLEKLAKLEELRDLEHVTAADYGRIEVSAPAAVQRGFATLAENLQAIINAGSPAGAFPGAGQVDPRLLAGPTGASAGVGADGGFLIQQDHAVELMNSAFETGVLTSRCSEHTVGENSDGLEVTYVEQSKRTTGNRWGGVQVYRVAEADTVTPTRPKLGKWECRLEDMMGLCYVTERLMRDAGAMAGVIEEAFRDELAYMADEEVMHGTGVGQCLGILKSKALVTVSKEGGQAADSVDPKNLTKMWTRMPVRSRLNSAWFVNLEVEGELPHLTIGDKPVYLPAGGLSASPYGAVFGRPVIPIEHAPKLGDLGDIVLADLKQYKLVKKGAVEAAQSIHVRFAYNERVLRWVTRFSGAPKLKEAITPARASAGVKLSPFVTLEAR